MQKTHENRRDPLKITHQEPLKLLIVAMEGDSLLLIRQAITNKIRPTDRVYESSSLTAAKPLFTEHDIDCVIMEILGQDEGKAAIHHMRSYYPAVPLVIISDTLSKEEAFSLIRAGAEDCFTRDDLAEGEMADSVRDALQRRIAKRHSVRLQQALIKERDVSTLQKEFTALVTHEFRTPLAIIYNAIQLIRMRGGQAEELDAGLAKIERAVNRLSMLINNVVLYSKIEEGQGICTIETLDAPRMLQQVVNELSEHYGAGRVTARYAKDAHSFHGDRILCDHIFTNIIGNALKYSQAGSAVEIFVYRLPRYCCFRIGDCGVGMQPEDVERLGAKFFRGAQTQSIMGTGLGIHLVDRFIGYHHGAMYVCSEPGVGTIVELRFPWIE